MEEYLHEKKKFWEQCSKDLEDNYTQAEQAADSQLVLRQYAAELEILRYKEVWINSFSIRTQKYNIICII